MTTWIVVAGGWALVSAVVIAALVSVAGNDG